MTRVHQLNTVSMMAGSATAGAALHSRANSLGEKVLPARICTTLHCYTLGHTHNVKGDTAAQQIGRPPAKTVALERGKVQEADADVGGANAALLVEQERGGACCPRQPRASAAAAARLAVVAAAHLLVACCSGQLAIEPIVL